jgi:hypothetical protein
MQMRILTASSKRRRKICSCRSFSGTPPSSSVNSPNHSGARRTFSVNCRKSSATCPNSSDNCQNSSGSCRSFPAVCRNCSGTRRNRSDICRNCSDIYRNHSGTPKTIENLDFWSFRPKCSERATEISQLRSGWNNRENNLRPERTPEVQSFRRPFRTLTF